MKQFEIEAVVSGTIEVEDPKCPWEWRGSGCYTKSIPAKCNAAVLVATDDPKTAAILAEEYLRQDDTQFESVRDVEIIGGPWEDPGGTDAAEEGVTHVNYSDYL